MMRRSKSIIHVNRLHIRDNLKDGGSRPVFSIKKGKSNTYCSSLKIDGPSELIYSPKKPLSCGVTVWIETFGNVEIGV